MRIALLENPGSGSGDADDAAALLREHGVVVDSFPLEDAGRIPAASPDRVVVAGGDGSLGRAADTAARAGVPLAVLPVGTANDFARAMELPADAGEAAALAASGRTTRALDLAWMDDRPFVNAASVGLAPAAARRATGLKRALGSAAYLVGGVRAALSAQPLPCRATCDGVVAFDGDAWQLTVACTGSFGAGSELDADPHDGELDLVAIESGSRLALALRAWGLRRGSLESQPGVRSRRGRRIDLDVPAGTDFNVDGELVQSGSSSFRVDPGAVELVVG